MLNELDKLAMSVYNRGDSFIQFTDTVYKDLNTGAGSIFDYLSTVDNTVNKELHLAWINALKQIKYNTVKELNECISDSVSIEYLRAKKTNVSKDYFNALTSYLKIL